MTISTRPASPPAPAARVARLWTQAGPALRQRMLACLVSPLGTLALAAVADGAFAPLLMPGTANAMAASAAALFSPGQIQALAEFASQVDPDVVALVQQLAAG